MGVSLNAITKAVSSSALYKISIPPNIIHAVISIMYRSGIKFGQIIRTDIFIFLLG